MPGSSICLKLQSTLIVNMVRSFLILANVFKKCSIFAFLFYCFCIKDFIDIYVYSIIKITQRTLWILQAVGLLRALNNSLSSVNKTVQTDIIKKKDTQSSPFEYHLNKKLCSSLQTSPSCKLKLSFSPPKTKTDEIQIEEMSNKPPAKELENSPAILKLEAEIPSKEAFHSATYSQTPLCNINLSLIPETRVKEAYGLSLEERNILKRKWQSWKLRKYTRKMKTPVFLKYQEDADGIFTCSENGTFSEWSPEEQNKKSEEPESPRRHGCCSSFVSKLKSKLRRENDCPPVSYSRF